MNIEALMDLVKNEDSFKKAFRKTDATPAGDTEENTFKNEIYELIANQFKPGRVPFVHQVVLPDGSQIRVKFTDTVKKLYNSKNVELTGKESYLSYMEVVVAPIGTKAYSCTFNVNQIVWGSSPSKARIKHAACIASLEEDAKKLGIDLSVPNAWNTSYSENY